MSLRATFRTAAKTAMDAFDDVPVAASLRVERSTYDPANATNTKTTTDYALKQFVKVRFKREEIGASLSVGGSHPIRLTDEKGIFLNEELPSGVVPSIDDKIVVGTEIYTVVDKVKDPADVVWILQMRKH